MKLFLLNLLSALSILLLISTAQCNAQSLQRDTRPRTASISGRVTVGGAPAANVLVTVAEADPRSQGALFGVESPQGASIEVRTGSDGRYRVTGLTEGSYVIRALSKAYVLSKSPFGVDAFRTVTVDEGELRDEVDIALVCGGVITGRVIDAEGRPVIGTEVRLFSVDEKGRPKEELDSHYGHNEWMLQTDDRGVYRIYGLTAGRYILGAGGEWASGLVRRKSSETFHPDATDQNQAKIIEVKAGAEVADIDIRLCAGEDTYAAAGRVVDAETGQPLPRVSVLCMEAAGGTRHGRPAATDDEGRFKCANLAPGRYELSLWERRDVSSPHYSEKIRFEVTDSDVGGLEVKAIRGATISGVVVVEGASDPAVKAKLQRMSVVVQVERLRESDADSRAYERPDRIMARIAGDGGFRLAGASPGMASFYLEGDQENAFSIRRIERDGAEIRSAFEIGRGEQITGVRIIVAHDNGTIRGQVEIAGAKLPEGWQLDIWATPIKTTTANEGMPAFHTNSNGSAFADEKGRFVIERLTPGEYELSLNAMVREGQDFWTSAPGTSQVKQRVTVRSGSETMVKLTLDLERK
ncbi:MAG TPA: carboxypeptidase-like regulatory domain-containing protein [Blastocatellia bacterium]|nr:carboxypeptidase-like regulatory domain-containing protein [Blastocatellia bacterium]